MKKIKKVKPKKIVKKKKVAAKKKPISKKKPAKRAAKAKPAKIKAASKPIGTVTHFYNEISVAIIRFKEPVAVGSTLHFKGATTDFQHPVTSMQLDHKPIAKAPKGKLIGIKVKKRVREGDKVHRIK